MSNYICCSVKDSITQFKTSKCSEIYDPNMQHTTSWLQMNITVCRMRGFEEAGIRPALVAIEKNVGGVQCCGLHCSLGQDVEDFFFPEKGFLNDNFRVCKET